MRLDGRVEIVAGARVGDARDCLLLAGASSQLAMCARSVGYVPADAEQLRGSAVLENHGCHRFDPSFVDAGARKQPITHAARLAGAQCLLNRRGDSGAIFRLNQLFEIVEKLADVRLP